MRRSSIKRAFLYIVPCMVFAAMLSWFVIAVTNTAHSTKKGELSALQTTVEKGITMCYAIEGTYPQSVDYLCANYGLIYDKSKYIIHYESFASNVRPTVTILERRADNEKL